MTWRRSPVSLLALLVCACGVTEAERAPVDSIAVNPPAMSLSIGGTGALDVELKDASGNILRGRRVFWASANPAVASVSDRGVVTAVSAGQVEIAATSEGKSAIAQVSVAEDPQPVAAVAVGPTNQTLFVAQSVQLNATAFDSHGRTVGGRPVAWLTNNPSVASVSQSGVVTGVSPGVALITAAIEGSSGSTQVTVKLVPVHSVTLAPSEPIVEQGGVQTLTATLRDAAGNILTGRAISWSSSDTRIAGVDQAGTVFGVRRGTARITATSEGREGSTQVRIR
jgi:uncharacterized protein YjdB